MGIYEEDKFPRKQKEASMLDSRPTGVFCTVVCLWNPCCLLFRRLGQSTWHREWVTVGSGGPG